MCGIAGMVDLARRRPVALELLQQMADALTHRGPDEDGYLTAPGIGFANRRLSIVGLADGKQPIYNEDQSVAVVFNGEFFDYPEIKARLEARGHRFATHCDTELIPHLWEDHQEGMFEQLRGQFSLALWDRKRQCILLARDRFGICPLYWSRQSSDGGDWLLFGSEVKALLASGLVTARPDPRGIDQVFNFFAVPGPATCFEGVNYLQPGTYLRLDLAETPARLTTKTYWQIDFPDEGQEEYGADPERLVDEFERLFMAAVDRRLRADVPVVSYLSGGIDSSIVVALAAKIRGTPIPTFTIQIQHPRLDETSQAAVVSRHIGSQPVVVPVGDHEVLSTYPELIRAAEAPVIDTSCAALLLLARRVHQHGYKVALTGEGSDEWLAGYSWYKIHKLVSFLDVVPGLRLGRLLRRGVFRVLGADAAALAHMDRIEETIGDHTPFQDIYTLTALTRPRFYSGTMLERLRDYSPYLDLEPNFERMRRWHPFNRSLYWAGRIHLPGHLLSLKGDRVAMNSSVEVRYPFLDEDVFDFLARLHPRWKLRGFKDKYILRLLCQRHLPREVAWRPKGMFRAPRDSFFDRAVPPWIDQLLSEDSLRRTGFFDPQAVRTWADLVRERRIGLRQRTAVELGLVGVVSSQLWYHLYVEALADLPAAPTVRRLSPV
jgi:asparagine synthase (glutamine-hydrolysing)